MQAALSFAEVASLSAVVIGGIGLGGGIYETLLVDPVESAPAGASSPFNRRTLQGHSLNSRRLTFSLDIGEPRAQTGRIRDIVSINTIDRLFLEPQSRGSRAFQQSLAGGAWGLRPPETRRYQPPVWFLA